jgi:hypothetical protein
MNFLKYVFTFLLLFKFKNGQQWNSLSPAIFNNYFRYNKCNVNDQIYIEEKCDSFQPSCNDDLNCSPGFAFKINWEQCPPQDVSNCFMGFICLGCFGGCWTCQCLLNVCGFNPLVELEIYMKTDKYAAYWKKYI